MSIFSLSPHTHTKMCINQGEYITKLPISWLNYCIEKNLFTKWQCSLIPSLYTFRYMYTHSLSFVHMLPTHFRFTIHTKTHTRSCTYWTLTRTSLIMIGSNRTTHSPFKQTLPFKSVSSDLLRLLTWRKSGMKPGNQM